MLQPVFYGCRPLAIYKKVFFSLLFYLFELFQSVTDFEILNGLVQIGFDLCIIHFLGWRAFTYLFGGFLVGLGKLFMLEFMFYLKGFTRWLPTSSATTTCLSRARRRTATMGQSIWSLSMLGMPSYRINSNVHNFLGRTPRGASRFPLCYWTELAEGILHILCEKQSSPANFRSPKLLQNFTRISPYTNHGLN